jgi:hypothetical protein
LAPRALPRFLATTGPSARLSPSLRYAVRLAQLPCFRGFSPRGEEPFPVSIHGLVHVLSPLPRRVDALAGRSERACCLRPYYEGSAPGISLLTGPQPDVHRVVTARAFAHPAHSGALSVGFTFGDLSRRRHPSYAASTCYRFGTCTLWTHGFLQASHNLAEQDLRPAVQMRHVMFCLHSPSGADTFSHWMSITQTLRKLERPLLPYLRQSLAAHFLGSAPPSLFGRERPDGN